MATGPEEGNRGREPIALDNSPCLIDQIADALNQAYDHEGKEVNDELSMHELPVPETDLP